MAAETEEYSWGGGYVLFNPTEFVYLCNNKSLGDGEPNHMKNPKVFDRTIACSFADSVVSCGANSETTLMALSPASKKWATPEMWLSGNLAALGHLPQTSKEWAEASALYGHTRTLCQEAAEMLDDDDPRAESLAELVEMVQGAWHRTAAHALLLKSKQETALSAGVDGISIGGGVNAGACRWAGRPLQERLKEFDPAGGGSGTAERGSKKRTYRIADFPPSLQLVPCKPRLLDLAFDELEFPDIDERAGIEKEPEVEEEPKGSAAGGGGISGWVGWALGRSKD